MGELDTRPLEGDVTLQSAWMRRLVRRLVPDVAGVDDVMQEARLAALRRERAGEDVSRGWLVRVALNFARKRRRDDASRRAIERETARREAQPAVDEVAARLDAQRALAEELRLVPEPYRTTLVQHFFDGHSAARIARASGLPATTVRTRLARGLELLRERLDRRHGGDRRAWSLALAPLALPHVPPWLDLPSAPLGTVVRGALLMKGAVQLVAAGALVVAAGVGVWWGMSSPEAASAPPRALASAVAPPQELEGARASTTAIEPNAPVERAAIAASAIDSAENEPAAVVAPSRVEARIVDADLRPLLGARLVLDRDDAKPAAIQIAVRTAAESILEGSNESAASTRDGRVALDVHLASERASTRLHVEADGFASTFLEPHLVRGTTTSLGDVVMRRGGAIRGRVEDVNGRPLADARVLATAPEPWVRSVESAKRRGPGGGARSASTRSRADGSFDLAGVAPGGVRVWAEVPAMRFAVTDPITVRADETVDGVVLVVEPLAREDEIAGRILDADGAPATNATLIVRTRSAGSSNSFSRPVDAEGRFRFRVVDDVTHELIAKDGSKRFPDARVAAVEPGMHDVELRFAPDRFIDVVARDGREGVELYAVTTFADDGREKLGTSGIVAAPEGRARVRVPSRPFFVEVAAAHFALARLGPFTPEAPPASLEFALERQAGISGRVVARGAPVAGARVVLQKLASASESVEIDGYPAFVDPRVVDEFVTGADGAFFLRAVEAGDHCVRAEAPSFAPGEIVPLAVEPGAARGDLEIALGAGGVIEGRVQVAAGRTSEGIVVAINHGDGKPRTVRTDSDGAFRFERVMPGRWRVARGRGEVDASSKDSNWAIGTAKRKTEIAFNCDVREGATTTFDLDLREDEPCVVRGTLAILGEPARGWTLAAWPGDQSTYTGEQPSTAIDERGEFTLTIEEPGPVRFAFSPPQSAGVGGNLSVVADVVRGANTWRDDLDVGRIEGRARRPTGEHYAILYQSSSGKRSTWLLVKTDAQGNFTLPIVLAGAGKFVGMEVNAGMWGESTTLAEVELARGETKTVELR